MFFFFFSSRRRHTRWPRDWSSDVCSSDLDPVLAQAAAKASRIVAIRSSPPGAVVEVEDYQSLKNDWLTIGTTPLEHARIPSGYLRWKISKAGLGESITAPMTFDTMTFNLDAAVHAPDGMVP